MHWQVCESKMQRIRGGGGGEEIGSGCSTAPGCGLGWVREHACASREVGGGSVLTLGPDSNLINARPGVTGHSGHSTMSPTSGGHED